MAAQWKPVQTVYRFHWLALQKIYLFVIAEPGAIFSSPFHMRAMVPPESLAGSPGTFHALPHPQLSLMEVRWILLYTNTSTTPPAERLRGDYSPQAFSPWQAASSWSCCPAASPPLKAALFAVGRAGKRRHTPGCGLASSSGADSWCTAAQHRQDNVRKAWGKKGHVQPPAKLPAWSALKLPAHTGAAHCLQAPCASTTGKCN